MPRFSRDHAYARGVCVSAEVGPGVPSALECELLMQWRRPPVDADEVRAVRMDAELAIEERGRLPDAAALELRQILVCTGPPVSDEDNSAGARA